jgi:hypothetical protein
MIIVGIHSGVTMEKAPSINDKGSLEIYMKKGKEVDAMDMFTSSSDSGTSGPETNTFIEFNPLATSRFSADLTAEDIIKDIQAFKSKLAHIVKLYKTEDKSVWNGSRGTGITNDNMKTKVLDQGILDKIYKNTCEDFVKNMSDVDLSKEFHLKTVRQSAKKHFSKLPDSKYGYEKANAFIQDGALPCTLEYTKYELGYRKGQKTGIDLSDGSPVVADAPITAEEASNQSTEIDSVFG